MSPLSRLPACRQVSAQLPNSTMALNNSPITTLCQDPETRYVRLTLCAGDHANSHLHHFSAQWQTGSPVLAAKRKLRNETCQRPFLNGANRRVESAKAANWRAFQHARVKHRCPRVGRHGEKRHSRHRSSRATRRRLAVRSALGFGQKTPPYKAEKDRLCSRAAKTGDTAHNRLGDRDSNPERLIQSQVFCRLNYPPLASTAKPNPSIRRVKPRISAGKTRCAARAPSCSEGGLQCAPLTLS